MWNKKPEVKCEHDECAECHHLIAKGSGQEVTVIFDGIYGTYYLYYGKKEKTSIFCELHKKPYDKLDTRDKKTIYYKKVDPWKQVNEDGTDYKEPKKK